MEIFYTDHFVLPLPEGHRFPKQKYSLLRQRVMQAGLSGGEPLCEPRAATEEEILRAGLPVAIVMAGGYARNIADTVDIHFSSVEVAAHLADAA